MRWVSIRRRTSAEGMSIFLSSMALVEEVIMVRVFEAYYLWEDNNIGYGYILWLMTWFMERRFMDVVSEG